MENLPPHWRKFLSNLAWYLATLIVLLVLIRFLRTFPVVIVLWLVGLGWGGILAFQFSQLLFGV